MSLRDRAEKVIYEADAPKRRLEAERQRVQKERERQIAEESEAFLAKAKRKLKRTLGADGPWEIVESHPTYCVLRDESDEEEYPLYTKLTLCVTSWEAKKNGTIIRYAPYKEYGKDYTNNVRGTGMNWHGGSVVTDLLSLGRAIQAHEEENIRINRSMPDHLP